MLNIPIIQIGKNMTRVEKDVYEEVYAQDEGYATPHAAKIKYVEQWATSSTGHILDVGCGRGEYMRSLLRRGHEVFGIELSTTCCDKYLSDVEYDNIDIKTYCSEMDGYVFDRVYSTDVLEHIPPEELEETLVALSTISNKFLFMVATGSDIKLGHELHVSNHTYKEWNKIIGRCFKITQSIDGFDEWPYIHIFECENMS